MISLRLTVPLIATNLFLITTCSAGEDKDVDSSHSTQRIPPLTIKQERDYFSFLPESISRVAPKFCLKKAGFQAQNGPAELANNFFQLFNILRETPTPLASKKENKPFTFHY